MAGSGGGSKGVKKRPAQRPAPAGGKRALGGRPPPKKQKLAPTADLKALAKAEQLLEEKDDFAGAASIADAALAHMGDLSAFSRAALVKGKALLRPLVNAVEEKKDVDSKAFRAPWDLFKLARRLDPENDEAARQLDVMKRMTPPEDAEVRRPKDAEVQRSPFSPTKEHNHPEPFDVLVVGAGCSGVGVAIMLTKVFGLDPQRVLLVERGDKVGDTFRKWPREMRFISPSFNQQGWTNSFDLNAVVYGTSPAFSLHSEHPTGEQYAEYLSLLAEAGELRVRTRTDVTAVRPFAKGDGFEVEVLEKRRGGNQEVTPAGAGAAAAAAPTETLRSRYVIWAAGEFQYPRLGSELFPGAKHCRHNSSVRSWAELPGDDFVIIGGYESGMDAAYNLSQCKKRCSVVSSTACWRVVTADPSTELAPYTAQRLQTAMASPTPPRLFAPFRVLAVEPQEGGGYLVKALRGPSVEPETPAWSDRRRLLPETTDKDIAETGATELALETPQAPLLCAGFEGSVRLGVARELFAWGMVAEAGEGEGGEEESGKGKAEPQPEGEGKEMGAAKAENASNKAEDASKEDVAGKEDEPAVNLGAGCAAASPLVNEFDESTKTPGLFLVGPAVRHAGMSFCFVYKFRQRFGIVAEAIARGLGFDTTRAVERARDQNMFLDDFSCCKGACGGTC